MSSTALPKLMDTIEQAELERVEDFVADAHALHALAIAKLPATEREHVLWAIESGLLRHDVGRFDKPSPYPKTGRGH
jgi:hypothetical protein